MTRSTADWQALLDVATPGPWWDTAQCNVTAKEGLVAYVSNREGADPSEVPALSDATLIAAAPEAVAEVIRLRESMTEIAQGLYGHAHNARKNGEYVAAVGYSEAADRIYKVIDGKKK